MAPPDRATILKRSVARLLNEVAAYTKDHADLEARPQPDPGHPDAAASASYTKKLIAENDRALAHARAQLHKLAQSLSEVATDGEVAADDEARDLLERARAV